MQHPEMFFCFLAIAFVYASVGFGGGSGYLALLSLYAFPFQEMKLTALVCNIVVVTGGAYIYIRRKELPLKKIVPLIIASVPMAYMGARLRISQDTFFILLGCCLAIAGALLWIKPMHLSGLDPFGRQGNYFREILIGAGIGFLSGMVGIGGGIFLAPLLNLLKWDTPKKIAATASFFILINSLSGIAGQLSSLHTEINLSRVGLLAGAVLIGGQVGSRVGSVQYSQLVVKRVTAILVFLAGANILLKHM